MSKVEQTQTTRRVPRRPTYDENHILAQSLYNERRSWFTRVFNEDGFSLYRMDKADSQHNNLYTPCDGWMVRVPDKDFSKLKEAFTAPGYSIRDAMHAVYDEQLADSDQCIDIGVARFCGKEQEAREHNAPIIEAQKRVHDERRRRYQAERRTDEEASRRLYKNTIMDAEHSVMLDGRMINGDVCGKNIILQVFRENGIELPFKTQGWVKSSLTEIYYDDKTKDWSYRCYGRPSSVIQPYIDELVAMIRARGIDYYVAPPEDLPTYPPAEAAKCHADEDAEMEVL